jgi:hypothetical protein
VNPLRSNSAGLAVLTGLALIGSVVLVALGHPVPDFLSLAVVGGVTGMAGVTMPPGAGEGLSAVLPALVERVEALAGHKPTPGPLPAVEPLSAAPSAVDEPYEPHTGTGGGL